MSKRPKEGRAPRSGVRSLVGYLRDRPIGIKLGFIMFVPILAIVIVGANGLVAQISTTNNADRARTLATLTQFTGAWSTSCRPSGPTRRWCSAQSVEVGRWTRPRRCSPAQTAKTDIAAAAYTVAEFLAGQPAGQLPLAARPDPDPARSARRRSVARSAAPGRSRCRAAVSPYTALISSLLQIRDDASQLAGDSTLSFEMRAAASIASDKEYVSQERYLVLTALLEGSMPFETAQAGHRHRDRSGAGRHPVPGGRDRRSSGAGTA